jgi:hypothetical protein
MSFEHRAGLPGAIASDLNDTGGLFKLDDYFALKPQTVRGLRDIVCKDVDPVASECSTGGGGSGGELGAGGEWASPGSCLTNSRAFRNAVMASSS